MNSKSVTLLGKTDLIKVSSHELRFKEESEFCGKIISSILFAVVLGLLRGIICSCKMRILKYAWISEMYNLNFSLSAY